MQDAATHGLSSPVSGTHAQIVRSILQVQNTGVSAADPPSEGWRFYQNIADHLVKGKDLVITAEWARRPITWVKPYGHGRVLYTALGHDKVQTENPNFQRLIVNGVRWVADPDRK